MSTNDFGQNGGVNTKTTSTSNQIPSNLQKDEAWVPPEAPGHSFRNLNILNPQDLIRFLPYLPKDASKFMHILERERYNPNRNEALDKQVKDLLAIPPSELSMDDVSKSIPQVDNLHDYKKLMDSLPADQVEEVKTVLNRALTAQNGKPSAFRFQHTLDTGAFLDQLYPKNPSPQAEQEFKSAHVGRRQRWFDLSLYHLAQRYSSGMIESLRQCVFEAEHVAQPFPVIRRPCQGLTQGIEGVHKTIELAFRGPCEYQGKWYAKSLAEGTSLKKTGEEWNNLVACLDNEFLNVKTKAVIRTRPKTDTDTIFYEAILGKKE